MRFKLSYTAQRFTSRCAAGLGSFGVSFTRHWARVRPAVRASVVLLLALSTVAAAPKLRLNKSAIGPYSIAAGLNGTPLTIEAWNAGDGALALQASSSATWAAPTLVAARPCSTRIGACLPVEVALQTASLARGSYTAVVTIADPNAIDAPQTVTITIQVGGGVPDRIELFAAPGGAASASMTTNLPVATTIGTQNGKPWLALASESAGSFAFGVTYKVSVTPQSDMQTGDYRGSIAISQSAFVPDNKIVDVLAHVTTEPIAHSPAASLSFRLPQNTSPQKQTLSITNIGLGQLNVTSARAVTPSGQSWLSVGEPGTLIAVTADPSNLTPGTYSASVSIETDGINGPLTVPVQLEVIPQTAPWAYYLGAVNAANFQSDEPIAQGGIAALFGEQFLYGDAVPAESIPLATKLGVTRVLVNGQPAPLYYASAGQINFEMPFEIPAGEALVQVERDGHLGNTIAVQVGSRVPRMLLYGEYGVIQNFTRGNALPMPPTPGVPSMRAKPGDVLVIYAFGLGATFPSVPTGDAGPSTEPLARVPGPVSVYFGPHMLFADPIPVTPDYVGLAPTLVGVYQINVRIPNDTPRGDRVPLWMRFGFEGLSSNVVLIAVE